MVKKKTSSKSSYCSRDIIRYKLGYTSDPDEKAKIFKIKSIGDFHSGNIGVRSNGDLVYFDPIGGLLAMEGK